MKSISHPARMRPFASSDLPGVYRVCAEVDARGRATRQHLDAPDLPGHVYAGPYLLADPELSWVVADDLGIAGYIVATADAGKFERWREENWFPPLREQYPPSALGADGTSDDRYLAILHAPPRATSAFPASHPAELHIKLDPRAAGQGWGRQLVDALVATLRRRRVGGLHLSVSVENANAVAFYSRVGFSELARSDENLTMTRSIG